MITTIPQITQNFMDDIRKNAREGAYNVKVGDLSIEVFPYVFPPTSPFSESTHTVYDEFGDLRGKEVLDIGTGTGIQAIQAAYAGADKVDAVDIVNNAIECARHNIKANCLPNHIVNVWQSDIFSNIPIENRYDLIIANLPIIEADEEDIRFHSLIDPEFKYHQRLFKESRGYLEDEGKITLCHADLQGKNHFTRLEQLASSNGFDNRVVNSTNSLGYEWRKYEFEVRK